MYYIIENSYAGPNHDQHINADTIEIVTSPALTNMSKEIRIEGWCGTTNDWSITAHGEFETLEAARAAIAEKFGEVRENDNEHDSNCVESYKLGKYPKMNSNDTGEFLFECMDSMTAIATDEDIRQIIEEAQAAANHLGYSLDVGVATRMLERHRQELRDE